MIKIHRFVFLLAGAWMACHPWSLSALSDTVFVHSEDGPGSVALVRNGRPAPIFVDDHDWPGVLRAAGDLQRDFERVTGQLPVLARSIEPVGSDVVIVGTIGRSRLIDDLVLNEKIDISETEGRWEGYLIEQLTDPWPGVDRALVIAGSDRRGTIYGIYELSEQIGVSPWYWWADVPVKKSEALHVPAGTRITDAPVVRYRGFFINDEAPALTGWAQEQFGGANHRMYEHVFELILRLRGNYLWPAMWRPRAFIDDDPENARLAEEYGIVIGTSHHEPMMRAHDEWVRYGEGPWDYSRNAERLQQFWREGVERVKSHEKIVTLGMRGDGDEAMSEDTNIALLERVVADQRLILSDLLERPLPEIPQLWALYKEVQGYYEKGMRVPDDVTLLWADDNWGNIRRLPTVEERERPGGAGVYYHFDYVGGPRNYKWMNVTPITKVWEQMHLAREFGADRIWIVNVGDIKPMEFPIEFFLTYAWNPERWPHERLTYFAEAWAAREFGPEHAVEIAAIVNGYSRLNRQRTPELLAPETYSLIHYDESERVIGEWRDLVSRADEVGGQLDARYLDAFTQLVHHPVAASGNVRELHRAAGLNALYARQGRVSANVQAVRVRDCLARDRDLAEIYHSLAGGKWNHLMSEKKFGYRIWQTPEVETTPALTQVQPNRGPDPALAIEGSGLAWPSYGAPDPELPELDCVRRSSRWIELFNRGDAAFGFRASTDTPWLRVHPAEGSVDDVVRLEVRADRDRVPPGRSIGTVSILTDQQRRFTVVVPVINRMAEIPPDFEGFVESEGFVSIEAPHFDRMIGEGEVEWKVLPDHGRTVGGVTVFPVTAPSRQPGGDSPRLEFDVHHFASGPVTVEWHLAPSLDFQPDQPLQFAVSFDDAPPETVDLGTWSTLQTWEAAVADSVRRIRTSHAIADPGHHVLKFWMVTPGVVLQKILIDTGGLEPSYLGPPESPRIRSGHHTSVVSDKWGYLSESSRGLGQGGRVGAGPSAFARSSNAGHGLWKARLKDHAP